MYRQLIIQALASIKWLTSLPCKFRMSAALSRHYCGSNGCCSSLLSSFAFQSASIFALFASNTSIFFFDSVRGFCVTRSITSASGVTHHLLNGTTETKSLFSLPTSLLTVICCMSNVNLSKLSKNSLLSRSLQTILFLAPQAYKWQCRSNLLF